MAQTLTSNQIKELKVGLQQFTKENQPEIENEFLASEFEQVLDFLAEQADSELVEMYVKVTVRVEKGQTAEGTVNYVIEQATDPDNCTADTVKAAEIVGPVSKFTVARKPTRKGRK